MVDESPEERRHQELLKAAEKQRNLTKNIVGGVGLIILAVILLLAFSAENKRNRQEQHDLDCNAVAVYHDRGYDSEGVPC